MENAGARPVASGRPFCPTVMTCPLCVRPLEPIPDREDYQYARCAEGCGRVYLLPEFTAPDRSTSDVDQTTAARLPRHQLILVPR